MKVKYCKKCNCILRMTNIDNYCSPCQRNITLEKMFLRKFIWKNYKFGMSKSKKTKSIE